MSRSRLDGGRLFIAVDGLIVPNLLSDPTNPKQQFGSAVVTRRLVELAASEEYHDGMLWQVSRTNENALSALWEFTTGRPVARADAAADPEEGCDEATDEAAEARSAIKRQNAFEMVLSVLLRSRHIMVRPFFLQVLSVYALGCGVPGNFWSLLQSMYVLINKRTVKTFCRQVSELLRLRAHEDCGTTVKFVVMDNCSYADHITHQHVNRAGGLKHTVNWLVAPLDAARFPTGGVRRGHWHNGTGRFVSRRLFDPRRFPPVCATLWRTYIARARGGADVLAHPTVAVRPEQSRLDCQAPVLDVETAAYADVDVCTQRIQNTQLAGTEQILIVGDQQVYIRLHWLKLHNPHRNRWFLPLPGEWHFTCHALMAVHSLWYKPMMQSIVVALGFEKSIKGPERPGRGEWDSVELFVYYDRFYQMVIAGLLEHLAAIVPPNYQQNPAGLREAVKSNRAALYAIDFLLDFGLPWLQLRQAVRENNHTWIDLMWTYTLHWFRAAGMRGKTNYATLCVYVTFVRHGMVPELARIWTDMRTASLCGHPGRNVAWDFVLERMNRDAKQFVGALRLPGRVSFEQRPGRRARRARARAHTRSAQIHPARSPRERIGERRDPRGRARARRPELRLPCAALRPQATTRPTRSSMSSATCSTRCGTSGRASRRRWACRATTTRALSTPMC